MRESVIAKVKRTKLADELVIANIEKEDRAAELVIANAEKANRADELVIADAEKADRADELVIANLEKADRAAELVIANLEKANRAAELVIANLEKADRVAELVIADAEKAKRANELIIANKELAFQNSEKEKRADELITSNIELTQLLQLNTDKDRFISILGHDLKSPFNNLLGLSELLTENIHNYDIDTIEKLVNGINISAQNAHNLLDDILVWANSQQGSFPFNPQNLSLIDVCIGVLKTLKPIADAKNIVINCLAEDHLNVFADTDMLKTILRNLVSNAIKFTNNGGVINISAEEIARNVTISVSDNGVGISTDDLSKLFEISEVNTTKGTAKETGTGLGLLICKEFVEKHQGRIWVESVLGKGSDFKFTLPCCA